MPRSSTLIDDSQPTVYHVISWTEMVGWIFDDVADVQLRELIRIFGRFYFAEILGFCLMGNHFYILVRIHTDSESLFEKVGKFCYLEFQ